MMARHETIETTISNQTLTVLLRAAASSTLASLQEYSTTTISSSNDITSNISNNTSNSSNNNTAAAAFKTSKWASDSCESSRPYQYDNDEQYENEQLYVKLSTSWYCFLAFITAVGLFVSLVSNMIIIYLFTGTSSLRRNPSNIIAVNLSLSDLLYCIQWPSVIYCSLSQSTWMLEIDFVCKTFGFITVTTASASVLTVLAMSVERAIVIKYSIYAKSRYTIRSAWLIVVLIWIVSISSSLPPLFDKFNRFTLDPSKTSCTLDYLSGKTNFKLYMLVIYIVYWILPATIISICYIFIIMTFKRSSRTLKQVALLGSSPSWASSELSNRSDNIAAAAGTHPITGSGDPSQAPNKGQAHHLTRLASFGSRCGQHRVAPGRDRLRDSIRLSNFLGALRRSRSGQILCRNATEHYQHHHQSTEMMPNYVVGDDDAEDIEHVIITASNRIPPMTSDYHHDDGARHQRTGPRIVKRVASFYHRRLALRLSPQSSSDQAIERIGMASIGGRSQMSQLNERPAVATSASRELVVDSREVDGGETSRVPFGRAISQTKGTSDERLVSTLAEAAEAEIARARAQAGAAKPICDPNELATFEQETLTPSRRWFKRRFGAGWMGRQQPASQLPPSQQPVTGAQQLTGRRRISFSATGHSAPSAAELAIIGRLPVQGPLLSGDCHGLLVGSSNATISSEPNPHPATTTTATTIAARRDSQGRQGGSKLALVSRAVTSRLNRASTHDDDHLRAFTVSQLAIRPGSGSNGSNGRRRRNHQRSKTTNWAPLPPPLLPALPPPPPPETTCHFGNSSSQLSRAGMQIRLAKMSFYLILLWLISWTPIASLTLINLIVKCHLRANALVVFLANTMTKLGPTFDVFIYGISHPKIKREFIQIIKRLLMLNDGRRIGRRADETPGGGVSAGATTTANPNSTTNTTTATKTNQQRQRAATLKNINFLNDNKPPLTANRATRANWEALLRRGGGPRRTGSRCRSGIEDAS